MRINNVQVTVVGKKMSKTAVVEILKRAKHGKYKKFVVKRTKLFVHDPNDECVVNDVIFIKKSRPFSKKKHWLFVKKV